MKEILLKKGNKKLLYINTDKEMKVMLSPLDLKNKMMEPKKRKYYDKDETDDYLELVMEQYKQLYDENLELQKNVKSLNDGVQYYRSIENTMQKALVLAEKTAEGNKRRSPVKGRGN